MAAEKVQLSVGKVYGANEDAKRVIAQEMAQVRKKSVLPPLQANNSAMQAASVKMQRIEQNLRVPGVVNDKMQSARRGAALATALGNAGLEKQLAKEEMEKKKRAARLKELSKQPGSGASRGSSRTVRVPEGDHRSSKGDTTLSNASSQRFGSSHHPPSLSIPSHRSNNQGSPTNKLGLSRASTTRKSTHFAAPRPGRRYIGAFLDREEVHGVREHSRVGKLLAEFGEKDDWVSRTVIKHQMATILQANVRGWLLRLKWWNNPDAVVEALHSKLEAQATEAERRARLRKTLEIRSMSARQKKVAANVVNKLFGASAKKEGGSKRMGLGGKWAKLQKNADIAVQELAGQTAEKEKAIEEGRDPELAALLGSDQDSEFSDLEMEDITAVKLRAKTPPWQQQEESQWAGQYNKLTRNAAHACLEMRWDLDACQDRLEACRARRKERNPEQAEAEAQGELFDPTTMDLSPEVVASLLLPKYMERMVRLGLMDPSELPQPPQPTDEQATDAPLDAVAASADPVATAAAQATTPAIPAN